MAMIGGVTVGLVLLLALAGIGLFIHRRFVSSTPGLPKGLGLSPFLPGFPRAWIGCRKTEPQVGQGNLI